MSPTIFYLVRHGATEANLEQPPRLLGRCLDPPLALLGVQQAEAARDALAQVRMDHCYTSPLLRARQTAALLCAPHALTPQPLDALIECDLGRWEGLDWLTIAQQEPQAYQRFLADPSSYGHPGGESYQQVLDRVAPALEQLLIRHQGQALLVVAHQVVLRTYLAAVRGLPLRLARQITLTHGGIAVVLRQSQDTRVGTLEDSLPVQQKIP
jgi:broad specificity phosphatase PhoE